MKNIESKQTLPGAELNNNTGHMRCLTVVPTDLKALLEKLEAAKLASEIESETANN